MPAVSVIIPAYNQGHYLREAVQSVLQQTYQDFEVVIIDDGSTDNTCEVAHSFSDSRIQYIYQDNAGLSAARNTGIYNSHGNLVTFLDSDDLFLHEKLEKLVALLEEQPETGFVSGQAIYIDENGNQLDKISESRLPEDSAELLLGNPLHVGSVMLRRSWIDRVGEFDVSLRACEDWDLWLRLARAGCQMSAVKQPVSYYRVHTRQMTREAQRMRTAMLAVLDKTFSFGDLPESWQNMRDLAYAAAYLKSAARAYHETLYAEARQDLARCVRLDPGLLDDEADQLAQQLAGWATAPMVEDPLTYLENVYRNLPEELSVLRRRRRKDISQLAIQMAFEAYRKGDFSTTRAWLLRGLYYQPAWLRNRGVLSIFARSYLAPRA